jgi:Stress responsive A/B Barrel Domain
MASISKGFVHTVFFWLKEKNNQAHKDALQAGLHNLSAISEIKTAFIGSPADTNREVIDSSYSFSITFVFDCAKDQEIYQTHPDHLLFIDNCAYLWDRVQVYDAC